jgi:hypothetical protein
MTERTVADQTPVKCNRFIQQSGGTRSINRELEATVRSPRCYRWGQRPCAASPRALGGAAGRRHCP